MLKLQLQILHSVVDGRKWEFEPAAMPANLIVAPLISLRMHSVYLRRRVKKKIAATSASSSLIHLHGPLPSAGHST
jgi:hypothetical protein